MEESTDRQLETCIARWLEAFKARWMDGWMDGWVDGWMDGWMDGLIHRLIHRLISSFSTTAPICKPALDF